MIRCLSLLLLFWLVTACAANSVQEMKEKAAFRDEVRIAENYQLVHRLVKEEMVRCPFALFTPRPLGKIDTRLQKGDIRIGEPDSFSVLVLVEAIDDRNTRVEYFVYYSSGDFENYMKKLTAFFLNAEPMCK